MAYAVVIESWAMSKKTIQSIKALQSKTKLRSFRNRMPCGWVVKARRGDELNNMIGEHFRLCFKKVCRAMAHV